MFDFLQKNKPLPNIQLPMPQENPVLMRQQALDNTMNDYLNLIKGNQLPYANNIVNKLGADTVTNGIQQGLNFGIPDIAQWQQQYNNGAGRNNPILIPQNSSEIELANQNQFNSNNFISGDVQGVNKPSIWDKFLNGMQDMQGGFQENANTPFNFENLQPVENKSVMNRIGEGLGTAGRFLASPTGRGIAVGSIVGLTGGSPLEMLGYGGKTTVDNQKNRMRNDLYRSKLTEMGYDENYINSLPSYIDNDTFKNFSDGSYKMEYGKYRNRKLDQDSYIKIKTSYDSMLKNNMIDPATYNQYLEQLNQQFIQDNIATANGDKVQASNDTIKTGSQVELNKKRGNYYDVQSQEIPKRTQIMGQNANTNSRRTEYYGQNVNNQEKNTVGTKGSGRKNPDYGKHLAEYNTILSSGDTNRINYARNKFLEVYGEDPDKSLKTDELKLLLGL